MSKAWTFSTPLQLLPRCFCFTCVIAFCSFFLTCFFSPSSSPWLPKEGWTGGGTRQPPSSPPRAGRAKTVQVDWPESSQYGSNLGGGWTLAVAEIQSDAASRQTGGASLILSERLPVNLPVSLKRSRLDKLSKRGTTTSTRGCSSAAVKILCWSGGTRGNSNKLLQTHWPIPRVWGQFPWICVYEPHRHKWIARHVDWQRFLNKQS